MGLRQTWASLALLERPVRWRGPGSRYEKTVIISIRIILDLVIKFDYEIITNDFEFVK